MKPRPAGPKTKRPCGLNSAAHCSASGNALQTCLIRGFRASARIILTLTILTWKVGCPEGDENPGSIRYPRPHPRPALQPHGAAAKPRPAWIWERARGAVGMRERAGAGAVSSVAEVKAPRDRRLRGRASLASLGRPLRPVHTDRAWRRRRNPDQRLVLLGCRGDPAPGPGM